MLNFHSSLQRRSCSTSQMRLQWKRWCTVSPELESARILAFLRPGMFCISALYIIPAESYPFTFISLTHAQLVRDLPEVCDKLCDMDRKYNVFTMFWSILRFWNKIPKSNYYPSLNSLFLYSCCTLRELVEKSCFLQFRNRVCSHFMILNYHTALLSAIFAHARSVLHLQSVGQAFASTFADFSMFLD